MVANRFAYICAGLMIAIHNVCGDAFMAVTSSGNVYGSTGSAGEWSYRGNIFGGPVPVEKATLGQIKARWR